MPILYAVHTKDRARPYRTKRQRQRVSAERLAPQSEEGLAEDVGDVAVLAVGLLA